MPTRFHPAATSLVLTLALALLTGCGSGEGDKDKAASEPGAKVKARLVELLAHIKEGKKAEAAKWIVFRGEDDKDPRNWKDVCDYTKESDKKRVDVVFRKLQPVAVGAPKFDKYSEDKESEGTWLIWEITYADGETTRTARLASLEIKGEPALGDMDVHTPR